MGVAIVELEDLLEDFEIYWLGDCERNTGNNKTDKLPRRYRRARKRGHLTYCRGAGRGLTLRMKAARLPPWMTGARVMHDVDDIHTSIFPRSGSMKFHITTYCLSTVATCPAPIAGSQHSTRLPEESPVTALGCRTKFDRITRRQVHRRGSSNAKLGRPERVNCRVIFFSTPPASTAVFSDGPVSTYKWYFMDFVLVTCWFAPTSGLLLKNPRLVSLFRGPSVAASLSCLLNPFFQILVQTF